MQQNADLKTVEGFGDEWSRFDQSSLGEKERLLIFESYFSVFPWYLLTENSVGFDLGCGSGRWAKSVAPRIGKLKCIDASVEALNVAKRNLAEFSNCEFYNCSVSEMPVDEGSMDFGYSLGVLHHIPDPIDGIRRCVAALKPGAPFLVYLYYAFDNRPVWFSLMWRLSDFGRRFVSRLPAFLKHLTTDAIAAFVYFPLSRIAGIIERLGFGVASFPLAVYRDKSFYTLRTDALDRFGTRLEYRFSRSEIERMLTEAGLEDVKFSESEPFWCAVGIKADR